MTFLKSFNNSLHNLYGVFSVSCIYLVHLITIIMYFVALFVLHLGFAQYYCL
jgi:hypothetical protein